MTKNHWQPHSTEAEQSVLGGLLISNDAWDDVADRLSEEDFFKPAHQLIFRAIAKLHYQNEAVDVVTVSDWLQNEGIDEQAGGIAYLGQIAKNTPSTSNIAAYANIVRERAMLRSLTRAGAEISELGLNPGTIPVRDILDQAENRILQISEQGQKAESSFVGVEKLLGQALDQIEQMRDVPDGISGLRTGLFELDRMTKGLQNGNLIIIAGRPSMGKTSLAMNIAENIAFTRDTPKPVVSVFSMEMPGTDLTTRMLASMSRINQDKLRSGEPNDDEWMRLTSSVSLMAQGKLFIDDSPALSPHEVRARARRMKREHGLSLVILDYLQLMQIPGYKEGRTGEIASISRALKQMAKELDVPVIALSQLNRNLEQRPDKRPVMADLRESGGIEQDADLIVFVYRDVVYHPDIEDDDKPVAELIIGKQRNGPIGTCRVRFSGQFLRFDNLATEYEA